MGQRSEMDMTFTYQTMHPPVDFLRQTLVTATVHQAGTGTKAPSPNHSWQEGKVFKQMRWKFFIENDRRL